MAVNRQLTICSGSRSLRVISSRISASVAAEDRLDVVAVRLDRAPHRPQFARSSLIRARHLSRAACTSGGASRRACPRAGCRARASRSGSGSARRPGCRPPRPSAAPAGCGPRASVSSSTRGETRRGPGPAPWPVLELDAPPQPAELRLAGAGGAASPGSSARPRSGDGVSRLASSPSLVSRIRPVESASRRPTGYRRRFESTSSTTAGRRPGSRAVDTTPAGLLTIQTSRGSGATGRPSTSTPLDSSTSRAGSVTVSPPTLTRPCGDQLLGPAPRRDPAVGEVPGEAHAARRLGPSGRPLLAGREQALAQLALVLGRRIEAGWVGQLVEAGEAEELLEQRRRPVDRPPRSASGRTPRSGRARSASPRPTPRRRP